MSLRLTGDWRSKRCRPTNWTRRWEALADRIAGVPLNQLAMQKMMINQAYDNMGLQGTQVLATLFDGITRHSPEGRWFKDFAERDGFHCRGFSTAIPDARFQTEAGRSPRPTTPPR